MSRRGGGVWCICGPVVSWFISGPFLINLSFRANWATNMVSEPGSNPGTSGLWAHQTPLVRSQLFHLSSKLGCDIYKPLLWGGVLTVLMLPTCFILCGIQPGSTISEPISFVLFVESSLYLVVCWQCSTVHHTPTFTRGIFIILYTGKPIYVPYWWKRVMREKQRGARN